MVLLCCSSLQRSAFIRRVIRLVGLGKNAINMNGLFEITSLLSVSLEFVVTDDDDNNNSRASVTLFLMVVP